MHKCMRMRISDCTQPCVDKAEDGHVHTWPNTSEDNYMYLCIFSLKTYAHMCWWFRWIGKGTCVCAWCCNFIYMCVYMDAHHRTRLSQIGKREMEKQQWLEWLEKRTWSTSCGREGRETTQLIVEEVILRWSCMIVFQNTTAKSSEWNRLGGPRAILKRLGDITPQKSTQYTAIL